MKGPDDDNLVFNHLERFNNPVLESFVDHLPVGDGVKAAMNTAISGMDWLYLRRGGF